MKFIRCFLIVGLGSMLLWGCSIAENTAKNNSSDGNTGVPAGTPSNVSVEANAIAAAVNSAPAATPGNANAPVNLKRQVVDSGGPAAPATLQFQPAPEDSEIATSMTKDGILIEVRRFKNNPQFARIEAYWLSPKEKQLKFYLRNGKVVEVKNDTIANLKTATVAELMAIAGLQ